MQNGELYIYIQDIAANLSPPIAAIYILAIAWKRINEKGAFWALIIGLVAGVVRLIVNLIYREPICGEQDLRPNILKLHYILLTQKTEEFRLIRTTYWTRFDERERTDETENVDQIECQYINNESNTQSNGTLITGNADFVEKKVKESLIRNFFQWFCGINYKNQSESTLNDNLANIASIHQTKYEKRILMICLMIVISIAVTLFVYFSLPLEIRFYI
ncbi:unnamed protein product [Medioppia subpectinata]|uniref:Uncharacterized protein n=1 Tax=Medioppia subpectinata TaxID=1979941 RepID=A0A7R9L1Z8_9ACAR|nr:unnamed protein product [Medioppia subpectinata]CAG2113757.1 unnamed protein product [Medioppia subpectinata]